VVEAWGFVRRGRCKEIDQVHERLVHVLRVDSSVWLDLLDLYHGRIIL
jgi:hypothetical protein